MRLLESWLREMPPAERVLDVGCGKGSLTAQLAGLNVFGVDVDLAVLSGAAPKACVCAEGNSLPFANQSFSLIICHHSLEHFHDALGVIAEIRRVLRPDGRLFVSIPEAKSFSDRLYRFLLCGGGHFQRFGFDDSVRAIESGTSLHLAGQRELASSFLFVDKRNFIAAPVGRLPGPLPRRMRWLGLLPNWCFDFARVALNFGSRFLDRYLSTSLARYGWALAFAPEVEETVVEPCNLNVCMSCGAATDSINIRRVAGILYRCPFCSSLNVFFRQPSRIGGVV